MSGVLPQGDGPRPTGPGPTGPRPILILETTCDETAAAVVDESLRVLGSVVASQDELHQQFGGVVPEIAARAHLERILPVIDAALQRADVRLSDLAAVAVANTPGLAGSLLIGVVAAKTLSLVLDIPLLAVNHIHAHIYACQLAAGRPVFPCVGLVVSGGHSNLYACRSSTDFELLGSTIDDAAGEAFDKVASMLGLPYPGGPSIAKAAVNGDPRRYPFPRSFVDEPDRLQFSFSGLKTAVRYQLVGPGKHDFSELQILPQQLADLAASFQEAVVDCLVSKSRQAIRRTGLSRLCVGGGVAANRRLRERLQEAASQDGFELIIAPPDLCTDNAVMGAIAVEHLRSGHFAPLDLDAQPGLVR